jgi:hypothetical protein
MRRRKSEAGAITPLGLGRPQSLCKMTFFTIESICWSQVRPLNTP